jgi:hypothetical protein
MPYSTRKWRPSDSDFTTDEIMFVQDLALRAEYDADNVLLQGEVVASGISVVDISDQFDGVITSFSVPNFTSIKLFILTGWPPNGALRPSVDYNESGNSVELTSEVSAPPSGATGIILYEPA